MKDSQFWEGTAQVRAIPLKYPCEVMKEWEFFWAEGDYQCSQRLFCGSCLSLQGEAENRQQDAELPAQHDSVWKTHKGRS